jgi:hypothetical protein
MDQRVVDEQSKIAAESTCSLSTQATLSYMFDSHSSNIFKWLELVVMEQLELKFCEKTLTRSNTKLQPINVKTLKKHMFKHLDQVEQKIIARVMSVTSYSLVFLGWSEGSMHFVGFYF